MCEIFPEFESCCGVLSVRVGLILIAVLSITTGALTLSVIQQLTNINIDSQPAGSDWIHSIPTVIALMGGIFMFAGLMLLFSTFADEPEYSQAFVWLIFFNIFIGYATVTGIVYECITYGKQCLIGNMDWLSASTALLGVVVYLSTWFYFVSVANSYVLNPDII